MRNFAHHLEYEKSGIDVNQLKKNILEKKIFYNHFADKSDANKLKYSIKLEKLDLKELPTYLINRQDKYKEWLE